MTSLTPYPHSSKHASIFIGAFLRLLIHISLLTFLTSACKERPSTPDWSNEFTPNSQALAIGEKDPPSDHVAKRQKTTATTATQAETSNNPQEVRFLTYNLRNYLTMRRYVDGNFSLISKPEEAITHLVDLIKSARPDILGICEIGTATDLKNLQSRLKKQGIDLPHTHLVHGSDKVRSLAILSRLPIVSTAKPKTSSYQLSGRPFQISRGILDVTIQLPSKKLRFLGVHFKSKRPIPEADQELMRRNEAILLRKHINHILTDSPKTQLLAYGDFNDTKRSKTLYTVKGREHSQKRLDMLNLSDSRGETWTHHWEREDIYSRFDYVLTTPILTKSINRKTSRLLDPKDWEEASDHRALLIVIQ